MFDIFWMIPAFWRGMTSDKRQKLQEVINVHLWHFTINCFKQIYQECNVPFTDMHQVRLAHELVKKYPILIEMTGETENNLEDEESSEEKYDAKIMMESVNDGLKDFQLKPPNLKGKELFDHIVSFCGRQDGKDIMTSKYLGIDVSNVQRWT